MQSSPLEPAFADGSASESVPSRSWALSGLGFDFAALALLTAAVWAVYGRAINSPFIFDDGGSVVNNSSITRLWPLTGQKDSPAPLTPPQYRPTAGRPLVNLSLALNYHFGELNPAGYRVFNLIVHVFTAMLLMVIMRRTLSLEYFGGRFASAAGLLAFAVALLWALHPLQTETVAYVTQRTELMVGFFYLATLYCCLRYWATQSSVGRPAWLVLASIACLAGMACKEVMVTAPVVILLYQRTLIAGSFRKAWRNSWPLYLALMLGWGLLLYLNSNAPRADSAGFHVGLAPGTWWMTQCKVLLMYLALCFWPWPLSIHYEMPYLTLLTSAWPWILPVLLLIIGTAVLLWRRSAIGFAGAWLLIILSPTLIVPIVTEVAAERRMYLPLAAVAALVVVGGYSLARQTARRFSAPGVGHGSVEKATAAIAAGAALAVAAALGIVSAHRLAAYHDDLTLWQDTVIWQPDDPLAHNYLGMALLHAGRPKEAIDEFNLALRLRPEFPDAHQDLGLALSQVGRRLEAIQHFREVLRLRPHSFKARYSLGITFAEIGRPQEAITEFEEALQLRPNSPETLNYLGIVLGRAGRQEDAIRRFHQALQLQPNMVEAHINLGLALLNAGRSDEAIDQYQQALKIEPKHAEAHNNLGVALLAAGRAEDAIAHFQQSVESKPDYAEAYANLAGAFDALDRRAEARAAAEMALVLAQSHRQPELVQHIQEWLSSHPLNQSGPATESAPAGPASQQ